ncbi:ubiquinone/menaquinone biosynthesis C-methylase UbiE [Mycobacteroides chelonae]|nr:ubiquinone/menaquinone biosynthesis C-methylase UbiE [Mycobacteroides chelonae]
MRCSRSGLRNSSTGLDLNLDGIDFCRRRHDLPGLEFVQGDAESPSFPDQSFDVVINLESSHLYPHFPVFLTEGARVLRPGGGT